MRASKPAVRATSHALHYIGDPSGVPHLSGIPSRDLSESEVVRLAVRHGLSVSDFVAMACRGPFKAAPAKPAASSSADDSEKGDN